MYQRKKQMLGRRAKWAEHGHRKTGKAWVETLRRLSLISLLGLLLAPTSQASDDRTLALGIPPSDTFGESISLKYFPSLGYGLQGIFSFSDTKNETPFFREDTRVHQVELRALARFASTETMDLYSGIGIGFGTNKMATLDKQTNDTTSQKRTTQSTTLLLGVEYFFKEFQRLGFSAEIGFAFGEEKESTSGGASSSQDTGQLFTALFGLHYYLR